MNYDDYAIQARLFAMAFELLPQATTKPPETQARIWAVARFYAGMIDENELRRLFPHEADEAIRYVEKIKGEMLQPEIIKSWIFKVDLLGDRETLEQELNIARQQFDFFCKQVMVARERLGAVTSKTGVRLDNFTEYATKPFRNNTRRIPLEEWQQCLEVWWIHKIEGLTVRQISLRHGQRLFQFVADGVQNQKEISKRLKEAMRLIASATDNIFPA